MMANNLSLTPKHSSRNNNNLDRLRAEAREKRRNILHLILSYLKDNALEQTAECLAKEAQLDDSYRTCENVELDIILQEYQSYYYTKFQRYPKIIRKLEESELKPTTAKSAKRRGKSATKRSSVPPKEKPESPSESNEDLFQFEIISLNASTTQNIIAENNKPNNNNNNNKPFVVELEDYSTENKDLITQISQQVIVQEIGVTWADCLGLESAIEILKESTIYPLHYPEVFKDLIPWKGVLLHGPPGTGKTLLAKAVASESNTTFFNVTSSTFISKWRGESEKLIKHLFDMAKFHAPSTIFFDEIDALISGATNIQHEASKRFKSELLVQLDGISSTEGQIFVLASTNAPWDLDSALLRRFDKRVLVDMPCKEARAQILRHHLKNATVKASPKEMDEFSDLSEQYSGSDIKNLAKEVGMAIARQRIELLKKGVKNICNRVISFEDIKRALDKVRPSTSSSMRKKYYQWQNEHGAF